MKQLLMIFLMLFIVIASYAQYPHIESLRAQLNQTTDAQKRLEILLELCKYDRSHPGQLYFKYIREADSINKVLKLPEHTEEILYLNAIDSHDQDFKDSVFNALMSPKNRKSNPEFYSRVYISVLQKISNTRDVDAITKACYDAMAYADSINNAQLKIATLSLLGCIAARKPDYYISNKYLYQALNYGGIDNFTKEKSNARVYFWLSENYLYAYNGTKLDSALYYIKLGYEPNKKSMNYGDLLRLRLNEAQYYILSKKDLKLCKQKLDSYDSLYNFLKWKSTQEEYLIIHFDWLVINGEKEKAIALVNEKIIDLKEKNKEYEIKEWYEMLMKLYADSKDYEKAYRYKDSVEMLKDEEFKLEQAEGLSKYEAQYNTKEKELALLRTQLKLADERNLRNAIIFGSLIAAILGIIFFFRYRRIRNEELQKIKDAEEKRRIEAVKEQKENERKRISRELHDNIGAQLSIIRSSLNFLKDPNTTLDDVAKKDILKQIEQTAYDAVLDLRDTLWVINTDEVSFKELSHKLDKAIGSRIAVVPQLKYTYSEMIDSDFKIAANTAMNILRIIQEATSNTIKHAKAQNISLKVNTANLEQFSIVISDDGVGFEKIDNQDSHYGLSNMKERAKESSLTYTIMSNNQGTIISLNT